MKFFTPVIFIMVMIGLKEKKKYGKRKKHGKAIQNFKILLKY